MDNLVIHFVDILPALIRVELLLHGQSAYQNVARRFACVAASHREKASIYWNPLSAPNTGGVPAAVGESSQAQALISYALRDGRKIGVLEMANEVN